jgi:hypothetical protein
MDNKELLKLIRKDRPDQVIHEVTNFIPFPHQPFASRGVKYSVDVIMETNFFGTKVKRTIVQGLPYPVEPYREIQEEWDKSSREELIARLSKGK